MTSTSRLEIIKSKPIGDGLDAFRDSFKEGCDELSLSCNTNAARQMNTEVFRTLAVDLVFAFLSLPVARRLPSSFGRGSLFNELGRFISVVDSDDFDIERIIPLLDAVLEKEDDEVIWDKVYGTLTESTPPTRLLLPIHQTPWVRNTSSFANSSEYRKHMDDVLKEELGGELYVDVPEFYNIFFKDIPGLEATASAFFKTCMTGDNSLYNNKTGWAGWPEDAKEHYVLGWLAQLVDRLVQYLDEHQPNQEVRRRSVAQPYQPLEGSTASRKLDIGFVDDPSANENTRCHWSQILVPGELKNNPSYDVQSKAWLDLGRYVREVLSAQDSRRFVQAFTLCGSQMRLWIFDRVGAIASEHFNIHEDGLQFVSVILGFLIMDREQLGFDPTIITEDGVRYIKIKRNGEKEHLIIDEVIRRASCISGRATTCWRAHREGSDLPLVIKDSWQYLERDEEGKLLQKATEKGVINVARYYHHETVQVNGQDDDVCSVIRRGLDLQKARSSRRRPARKDGNSVSGRKRSSTCVDASLPPSKRTQSGTQAGEPISNCVHRRIIVADYGKNIYKASSRVAFLKAVEGSLDGYMSLYNNAGLIQSDISPGNMMINEDSSNPSWASFLIDLDLAIYRNRDGPSGAKGKTGTRAFMAIGVLLGVQEHSFMHDLESIFWVIFWICIHYEGPGKGRVSPHYDEWNYMGTVKLAEQKKGTISTEDDFLRSVEEKFTAYYQPLVPWVNRLRKAVFPNGQRWKKEDPSLPDAMRKILQEARNDPKVKDQTGS